MCHAEKEDGCVWGGVLWAVVDETMVHVNETSPKDEQLLVRSCARHKLSVSMRNENNGLTMPMRNG